MNLKIIDEIEALAEEHLVQAEKAPSSEDARKRVGQLEAKILGYIMPLVRFVRELTEAQSWRDAREELPEFDVEVLVRVYRPQFKRKYFYGLATRDESLNQWITSISLQHHVTHWQPLPNAPKEQQ